MGVGLDLGGVLIAVQVDALGFLGKYHRNAEVLGGYAGDADAGCLDREDLIHLSVSEHALKFFADLVNERDIHLVIQKTVYFQDVARTYLTVFQNSLFECLHISPPFHKMIRIGKIFQY